MPRVRHVPAHLAMHLKPVVDAVGTIVYGGESMPPAREIPGGWESLVSPEPGSLWITAQAARIGGVEYERLAPVLVAIVDTNDVAGLKWLHAVPFGIDESEARPDEFVLARADSSLDMPLRFALHHRLRLLPEQLDRAVGRIGTDGRCALYAALAGARAARRPSAATDVADLDDVEGGRPDPAVLMVLQRPWWEATGRRSR